MDKISRTVNINDFYNTLGLPIDYVKPDDFGGRAATLTTIFDEAIRDVVYNNRIIIDKNGSIIESGDGNIGKSYILNDIVLYSDGNKWNASPLFNDFEYSESIGNSCSDSVYDTAQANAWKTIPRDIEIGNYYFYEKFLYEISENIPLISGLRKDVSLGGKLSSDSIVIYNENGMKSYAIGDGGGYDGDWFYSNPPESGSTLSFICISNSSHVDDEGIPIYKYKHRYIGKEGVWNDAGVSEKNTSVYSVNGILYESDGDKWVRSMYERYSFSERGDYKSIRYSSLIRVLKLCEDVIRESEFYHLCYRNGIRKLVKTNKFTYQDEDSETGTSEISVKNIFSCGIEERDSELDWLKVLNLFIWGISEFGGEDKSYESGSTYYGMFDSIDGAYSEVMKMGIGDYVWINPYMADMLSMFTKGDESIYTILGEKRYDWSYFFADVEDFDGNFDMLAQFKTGYDGSSEPSEEWKKNREISYKAALRMNSFIWAVYRKLKTGKPHSTTIPYYDINFCMEGNNSVIGEYSTYEREWESGRRYYEGDTCVYEGDEFILKLPEDYENVEFFQIPLNLVEYYITSDEFGNAVPSYDYVKELDGKYFIERKYYYGYYDKNSDELLFDIPSEENLYEFRYWKLCSSTSIAKGSESGETESRLLSLQRQKSDFSDEGKELRYRICKNVDGDNIPCFKYLMKDPSNIVSDDEVIYFDFLDSIIVEYVGNTQKDVYDSRRELSGGTTDGVIPFIVKNGKIKEIRFVYYQGSSVDVPVFAVYSGDTYSEVDSEGNAVTKSTDGAVRVFKFYTEEGVVYFESIIDAIIDGYCYNGVKYTDEYMASFKKDTVAIDGVEYEFDYIDIDYESGFYYDDEINGTVISGIEFTPSCGYYDTTFAVWSGNTYTERNVNRNTKGATEVSKIGVEGNVEYALPKVLKEDDIIGNIRNKFDFSNLYIERGRYSAFERHNILSEVNTMDDLEKYRNDFFKLDNPN